MTRFSNTFIVIYRKKKQIDICYSNGNHHDHKVLGNTCFEFLFLLHFQTLCAKCKFLPYFLESRTRNSLAWLPQECGDSHHPNKI